MTDKLYDMVGIGSAIVDVISYRSEAFIEKHGLHKGASTLMSEKKINKLYKQMGASTECSGGGAANTVVGLSMLGGKGAFIGKVSHDYGGKVFRKSLEKSNVTLHEPNHEAVHQTARCLIMITETEEPISGRTLIDRTMAICLGASNEIEPEDVDEELIAASKVLFFEGFLWDIDSGKAAVEKAIALAKKHNVKLAMSLSDRLCVERHREDFLDLIEHQLDFFFCNEAEASALFNVNEERKLLYRFNELCKTGKIELAALTNDEKGSFLLHDNEIYTIDAEQVRNPYDVTGGGDMYAAGVLYGYLNNMPISDCGKLGSLCAAEVIKYLGARPLTDLKDLLEKV